MNHRKTNRHGLTLVEMMISVVLTLMVVFAVVRIFESLGESVTDGRATIEMSGNLRTAAQLLQQDLDGLTVTTLPPRAPEQGEGYLEILDGPGTDSQYVIYNSEANKPAVYRLVQQPNMVDTPAEPDGYLDNETYDTSVGDVDDILAFTSHRTEEPFSGMISDPRILNSAFSPPKPFIDSPLAPTLILDSQDAEIVWWLQVERVPNNFGILDLQKLSARTNWKQQIDLACGLDATGNPLDPVVYPNGTPEITGPNAVLPTPVRSLHRRVLLIRPDLDLSGIELKSKAEIDQFLSNNDISVRIIRLSASKYGVVPNTLADLSERHNRSYRLSWQGLNDKTRTQIATSRLLPTRPNGIMLGPGASLMRQAAMKDMVVQHQATNMATALGPVSSIATTPILLRKGRDIVISDVLGFDLQVWDPEARVRSTTDGDFVVPSDPGYTLATIEAGAGAFVDLGFAQRPKLPGPLDAKYFGKFGGLPAAKSKLVLNDALTDGFEAAVYCTWSQTYEHDGFNQHDAKPSVKLIDEGYDGIDNDKQYGIDDPGELETSPPYPQALRGLKITLRTMDFGTRQVRQTSVTKDFLPE